MNATTSLESKHATISIRSNRLAVEIAAPGVAYHRTRFDWTGFITQVTLDGAHTFCEVEDEDPSRGSGGIGICNEFGIEKPVGYNDAAPGQAFPKFGIGLLTRPNDKPYNFFKDHEIAQPFPIHVETAPDQARFIVDPVDCRGYAARETKTLRVTGSTLQIDYLLENTGLLPIDTHEYCHNFIAINRQPIGPGYLLRFPYPIVLDPGIQINLDILDVNGQQIRWKSTPQKSFYGRPLGFFQTSQPHWEIVHEPSGVGLREYDDFDPERVAIWGTAHVVSAEIFNSIHLLPGRSQSWTRRFEFFD